MIENIELIGIDEELEDKLIDELGYDQVLSMACNYEKIKNNIEILKSYGIERIEELLLYKNNIFFIDNDELIKMLEKLDKNTFSQLVNEDINVIDEIYD